jgi:hypothetical protein
VRWLNRIYGGLRGLACRTAAQAKRQVQKAREWLTPRYKILLVGSDLPKALRDNVLYVVEEDGFREHAAMTCPCRCGKVIQLNLLTDERPCWHLTVDGGGMPTLHPSVWGTKDCKSHFFLRKGKIIWCR